MLVRDTLVLIKSSIKRFLALFCIVLIGSAILVGLLSVAPIMRKSVSYDYFRHQVSDIQIFSNLGFSKQDIKILKSKISDAVISGDCFVDAYIKQKKQGEIVARVSELESINNKFDLIAGRLPQNENETVMIQTSVLNNRYELNQEIKLYLKDKNLNTLLKNTIYKIVGFVRSPLYLTVAKETSSLDNQELATVIYVKNTNFLADYYTSISLRLKSKNRYEDYTESYDNWLLNYKDRIEKIGYSCAKSRKKEISEKASAKILDAKKELASKIEEATTKLNKSEKDLLEAKSEYLENLNKLEKGQSELKKAQEKLEKAENEIYAGELRLKEVLANIKKISGKDVDTLYVQMKDIKYKVDTLTNKKNELEKIISDINALKKEKAELNNKIKSLENKKQILENKIKEVESSLKQLLAEQASNPSPEILEKIEKVKKEIIVLNNNLANLLREIKLLQEKSNVIDKQLNNFDELQLINELKQINFFLRLIKANLPSDFADKYKQIEMVIENRVKLAEANNILAQGKKEYRKHIIALKEGQKKLLDAKIKLDSGFKDLNKAKINFQNEVKEAQSKIKKAENDLHNLKDAKWVVLAGKDNYHRYFFANTLKQMKAISYAIPLLFFLVAILVCLTTMKRLLEEQHTQLGLYSALGFSRKQILAKYVLYALFSSLAGSILGAIIGLLLFPNIIYDEWKLMYHLPNIIIFLRFDIFLIGTISFSILMILVTYIVANKSLKEMPSVLMRPKGPSKTKRAFLEKIPFIWRYLSFFDRITLRNILRYKSRFLMTVAGVAGCTSLLILGFGIKDSLQGIIDKQYGNIFHYQQQINLKQNSDIDSFRRKIPFDNVAYLEYKGKVILSDDEKDTLLMQVYDSQDLHKAIDLRQRINVKKLKPQKGIIINEKFAKNHHLSVGDTLTIESNLGKRRKVIIEGICEMYFRHYGFMNKETYYKLFNEEALTNTLAILSTSDLSQYRSYPQVNSITDHKPFIANFDRMIKALDLIIVVVILAAGSLAFVVLINLSQVNIAERLREIATLKVLGFTNKEVELYIFKEIMLLAFIGAILGCPLGKIEHHYVMNVINVDLIMFGDNIVFLSYLISFVLTMLFTFIVLLIMKKNLRKINMLESLKSIE